MSAIAGVVFLDGRPAGPELLGAMLGALGHRGAASGAWSGECASLGQRSSHALTARPVVDEARGLVVVADARIDNRAELCTALGLAAVSDAELILHAYAQWGAACAARLVGDFAAVVWDRRARTACCLRDPMGVKPLYHHRSRDRFAFASEAKALLRLPGVSRELDEARVRQFLAAEHTDRESTLFREIRRVPAAHTLVVSPDRTAASEYWRPDPHRPTGCASPREHEEAFRALFIEAVRARLPEREPVGSTLSGGLDSSAVACTARTLLGGDASSLHTFSLTFEGLDERDLRLIDERPYIGSVVHGGGMTAHAVRGDSLSPLGDVDLALWHFDEPFFAPNIYLHWGMFGAARANGVRVLLDGFDGDSVVSHGFGRLNALARSGDWDGFEAEVKAFAHHRGVTSGQVLEHYGLPLLAELARRGRVPSWIRGARALRNRFGVPGRTLASRYGMRSLLRLDADLASQSAQSETAMHLEGIGQPLYQLTLEMADKAAAAFGLEARYPFFDRRLIDFCVAVPEAEKFAGGWPRFLFRRAMEGILPPEVQWRATKGNLSPNFHRRLASVDRRLVEHTLADASPLARWLDVPALDDARQRYFASPDWRGREVDGYLLFRATVLQHWLSSAPSVDLPIFSTLGAPRVDDSHDVRATA